MSIDSSGSVPQDGNIVPRIRGRDNGNVDEERCLGVTEVERGEVEEICNEDDLCNPEPAPNPQHNEAEHEEIVLRLGQLLEWHALFI